MNLFAEIRAAADEVSRRSRFVKIDDAGVENLARALVNETTPEPSADPAHRVLGDPVATLSFVIALNAVNFGSGYFPGLVKRPGCSGYFTIAGALEDHVAEHGVLDAGALAGATTEFCSGVFAQPLDDPGRAELMSLFASAWRELGVAVEERHRGRFDQLVASAHGGAESLVRELATLSAYRDESIYDGSLRVPLYKRAQITVSDLHEAFEGEGFGRFHDIGDLTMFADNLVPHVLRMEGVLRYDAALLARIDAGVLIPVGSTEEIEIRAVALHATERLVAACREEGLETRAQEIDGRLWRRGQRPAIKARPRHRTRCTFY